MNTLTLTDDELEFLSQLFDSDIAVTLKTVEVVAGLKVKVRQAQPAPPHLPGTAPTPVGAPAQPP